MRTDSYFTIGSLHLTSGKPCQDYAVADVLPGGGAFAIVADGCSTGGRTEVGASTVVLSGAQAIRHHWSTTQNPLIGDAPKEIAIEQRLAMSAAQTTLGCSWEDMLATCLYAYLSPQGGFIHLQGDGVAAWQWIDGTIDMVRFEWYPVEGKSVPMYPAYSGEQLARFVALHGGDLGAARLAGRRWRYSPGNGYQQLTSVDYTLGEAIRGVTLPLQADGLRCAAVFTDGATAVQSDEGTEFMDWKEAVVDLLAFKTTAGEFAKRRMIQFVKDARKRGKGPTDDLAYAVVMLD